MKKRIYGLLGRTLGHSYSPAIHRDFGLSDYRLFEVEPEKLKPFLERNDLGGVNVTIPYKIAAMEQCATLSETAKAIGSVNTIVRQKDGRLFGHNTDAFGFYDMAKKADIAFNGRKIVILGGGGASLTAQYIAKTEGAAEIIVVDIGAENHYGNIHRHYDGEIIINATPVGMYPHNGECLIDLKNFTRCCGVLDMIYNPRRTPLLMAAEEMEIPCSDGLPMLVAQAKAAEETFFETAIDDSEMGKVLAKLRRETENIVLAGGNGNEAAIAKALEKISGKEILDITAEFQKNTGKEMLGLFTDRETDDLLARKKTAEVGALSGKIIISGTVRNEQDAASLRQNGRIYRLRREPEKKGTPPLPRRFQDIEINASGGAEETAAAIWRDFCAYTNH